MRWLWISCLLLASLLPLSAEDWTTADGKTYKNVTVVGQEDDGVRITYDGGVGKIPYYELPVDIQKRFGQDVGSLAEKKQAVDKAIEDAVRNAADAELVKQPAEAPGIPGVAPQYAVPGGSGSQYPAPNGYTPGGGSSAAPNGTGPGTSSMPGGAPGNSTAAAGGPGGPNATNPAGPNAAHGTSTNATPGSPGTNTAANPGAHGAIPGGPANAGSNVALPALDEPVSRTPEPPGVEGAGGKQLQLTVANYTYNAALDVCYLDSPAIDVYPQPPPPTPPPPGQGSSLTLRIVTDGRTPQAPDRFEVTFLSVGGDGADLGTRAIVFSTDGGPVSVSDSDRKDSGSLPGGGQAVQYASFYLQTSEVHQICSGKPVTFNVGPNQYRIDERGAAILRSYLTDVDALEPATSSFVHGFYKLLARIPSFFNIISTVCEYIILGSFALLVAASIAAFILGISRFIKM